jgi:serine/threonine-protein kinase
MAMLHHPGVADVYDYGETDRGDDAYIVMAHVDGQPLNLKIAEDGRLDPATTMSIVAQAARALHAAHAAGIVHRDVKPGNLIMCPDGTVVLVDFGIARSAHSTTLTGVDEVIGSARYIAPEQVSKEPTGPATDVYALGAVAYHCLAGQPPFPGENPVAVAMRHVHDDPPPLPADVPQPVRDLVVTAMSKGTTDRFPSAAAMADAATAAAAASAGAATQPGLDEASAERTLVIPAPGAGTPGATVAGPTGAGPKGAGPASGWRRHRRAAAIGALALAALAVVIALTVNSPALFNPGSDPSAPSPQQPVGSPEAGQEGERGDGSGAPAQPGATPSAGGDSEPSGQPGETPAPGGGNPADPAPSGPGGGTEPTPPAEEEPTEPEPTQPAEDEEEPPASPVGQVPATGAPQAVHRR